MKKTFPSLALSLACGLFTVIDLAHAQGTAFTYQGQLQSGGAPANGTYDFEFTLYATNTNGASVAGPVTNLLTAVNSGLFLATVDFGAGVFTGSNYWLDIAVRTNGAVAFTELTARQPLTPAPYAIFANTASNLSGTLAAAQLTGALPASALTGNGSGLSGVNAASLNGLGASNFWQTSGNNLAVGQVLGSTNNQPLTLIANGLPAVVITPNAGGPDIILGAAQNTINGSSSPGSSILGGGGNYVSTGSPYSVIAGGQSNSVSLNNDFIGGGSGNAINFPYGVIGGGLNNNLSYSDNSVLGGGNGNTLVGSSGAVIGGGWQNTIDNGSSYTFLGGGQHNYIGAVNSVLVGGFYNTNGTYAYNSFIGGGANNLVSGNYASVPGGYRNIAAGQYGFAAGQQAQANHQGAFVWADSQNAPFASTNNDSFNVRAQGGVRLVTGGAGMTVDGQPVLAGTLTTAQLPASVVTNGASGVSISGSFSGNGANVTNVNAAAVDGLNATNFWQLHGNTGTVPGANFVGTADNQPLEFHVNGMRSLRLEFGGISSFYGGTVPNGAPNLIGGSPVNFVAAGVVGAVIGGGGATKVYGYDYPNSIGIYSDFSVIGGGSGNSILNNSAGSIILGGASDLIESNSVSATIGNGYGNDVKPNSPYTIIVGGYQNTIWNNASNSIIVGGFQHTIQANSYGSIIGGGGLNNISNNTPYSTIAGGGINTISTNSAFSTIGGGLGNTIQNGASYSAIGGGNQNGIWNSASNSIIAGGNFNGIEANSDSSTIGGGYLNIIQAYASDSFIGGGNDNTIEAGSGDSTVCGGNQNDIGAYS